MATEATAANRAIQSMVADPKTLHNDSRTIVYVSFVRLNVLFRECAYARCSLDGVGTCASVNWAVSKHIMPRYAYAGYGCANIFIPRHQRNVYNIKA